MPRPKIRNDIEIMEAVQRVYSDYTRANHYNYMNNNLQALRSLIGELQKILYNAEYRRTDASSNQIV